MIIFRLDVALVDLSVIEKAQQLVSLVERRPVQGLLVDALWSL